ncbi:Phage-related baseplate assembly protein [Planctomycetes bacterium Pan216]|uniref:Phage-related baseplate assembly protein n=1 Tax=Kolteria novifilia TaxID=2527975 RepID=A0A518B146_9BACT|nr:Phage-related baseplate assembly protein [Planctomycetes bacterium Pan216]
MRQTISMVLSPRGDDTSDEIWVSGLKGRESLSEFHEHHLELCAPRKEASRIRGLLGREVTITLGLEHQAPRTIRGIIASVSRRLVAAQRREHGDDFDSQYCLFEAHLVPREYPLSLDEGCEIFENTSLEEILTRSLRAYPHRIDLREERLRYLFAVRHFESTWAHLQRRLADAGAYYYFENDAEDERVCFSDDSRHAPSVARLGLEECLEKPFISEWKETQALVPHKVRIRDHHPERIPREVHADHERSGTLRFGSREIDRSDASVSGAVIDRVASFAPRFARESEQDVDAMPDEARRQARLELERVSLKGVTVRGSTNCSSLRPGFAFELVDAGPRGGRYLVTRTSHQVRGPLPVAGPWETAAYQCDFECIPIDIPYRPARPPKRPVVRGVEAATVVGQPHEDVTTDDLACVKVRFAWDQPEDVSSCWLRVAQASAGARRGSLWLPRNGDDVVVAFDGGDPDRPVVVASLYSAASRPRGDRADHRHLHGVTVRSAGGSVNEVSGLLVDNRLGKERVDLASMGRLEWGAEDNLTIECGQHLHLHAQRTSSDLAGAGPFDKSLAVNDTSAADAVGDGSYSLVVSGSMTTTTSGDSTTENAGNDLFKCGGVTKVESGKMANFTSASSLSFVGSALSEVGETLRARFTTGAGSIEACLGMMDMNIVNSTIHVDYHVGTYYEQHITSWSSWSLRSESTLSTVVAMENRCKGHTMAADSEFLKFQSRVYTQEVNFLKRNKGNIARM